MSIRDIIEGYITLRNLKKQGFVEEDNLSLGDFLRLVLVAEKNVRKGVKVDEKK